MRPLLLSWLFAVSFLLPARAFDPSSGWPVKGNFLVNVDDHAIVYVNGARIFQADIGLHKSKEIVLKVGDQVLVQLINDKGSKHFDLVFVSTDQNSIASFHAADFKILPDPTVTTISPGGFARLLEPAKRLAARTRLETPFENSSENSGATPTNAPLPAPSPPKCSLSAPSNPMLDL